MTQKTYLGKVYKEEGNVVFALVDRKNFLRVMENACRATGGRISSITGYDNGKEIELIYTFLLREKVLNIKVKIGRKNPSIESVTKFFPGAEIYERENFEMLGINFEGNPNLKPILLDKTSPKTPLRKKTGDENDREQGQAG